MSDCLGKPFKSQELWRCLAKFLPVESYSAIDKHHHSEDEEKMLQKLKINFVKENQSTYAEIKKAADSGDRKLAHRLAHTLKGNAGQVEKKRLQAAAAAVEALFVKEDYNLDNELILNLETELKLVLEEFTPLLSVLEAEKKTIEKTTDVNKIREILKELEPLLRNNDTESLSFLDELNSIQGTEEIAHQMEEYNFKKALENLLNFKKEIASGS